MCTVHRSATFYQRFSTEKRGSPADVLIGGPIKTDLYAPTKMPSNGPLLVPGGSPDQKAKTWQQGGVCANPNRPRAAAKIALPMEEDAAKAEIISFFYARVRNLTSHDARW